MFDIFSKKKPTDLNGQEFKNKFSDDKNAVLLDVRTPGEFQSGAIVSAKNIDYMAPDFKAKLAKLDNSKAYFVYCRSGNRSGNAVSIMNKEGFNAFNLVGGIGAFPKN
jgi:rhodanese-related sulfurtransferase